LTLYISYLNRSNVIIITTNILKCTTDIMDEQITTFKNKSRPEDRYVVIKEVRLYKFIIPWEMNEDIESFYGDKEDNKLEVFMKDGSTIIMNPIDVCEEKMTETEGQEIERWIDQEEYGIRFTRTEMWDQVESMTKQDGTTFPNIYSRK